MFFGGDPVSRRKVDLRGRSSKESDRQAILNKAKDEREQRLRARQRHNSAIRIQKCFRGRSDVAHNRNRVRQEFANNFGEFSERAGRDAFKHNSRYLTELLYFISPNDPTDLFRLVGACRHFFRCLNEAGGDVMNLFGNGEYAARRSLINYRVKRFSCLCLLVLHYHRESLKEELLLPADVSRDDTTAYLVETVLIFAQGDLPWAGPLMEHLARRKLFHLLRDLLLAVQINDNIQQSGMMSSLERLVHQLSLAHIQRSEYLKQFPFSWSLSAQVFSVPLLWQRLPLLKQINAMESAWSYAVHQMSMFLMDLKSSLPPDVSNQFPSLICLLGNILEVSRLTLAQPACSIQLVTDVATVSGYLMSNLPRSYFQTPEKKGTRDESDEDEDFMNIDSGEGSAPQPALTAQLQHASNSHFLKDMVRLAFSQTVIDHGERATAITSVCGFIYASFFVADKVAVISSLAYTAGLVPQLWRYINSCHLSGNWPAVDLHIEDSQLTPEVLGWMLPLSVFCPIFSHLVLSMDNEEFYSMQRPISIDDVAQLVLILKEGLWQLLWAMSNKPLAIVSSSAIFNFPSMKEFFIRVSSSLMAELHDRNSKRQFTTPQSFHAREAIEESFFHQAEGENTKARDLLKRAPFLIPFTSRVRVYTAQLTSVKRNILNDYTSRLRVRIQRARIVEDAFSQINILPAESLRAPIRVGFVNEYGVEEAGVDGGGMFKDFMETITKAAFDVQYGLFKETADHLLYPNPASHLVHDQHLLYFEFLGKILGKAMFEGILVDIPFATFFLRKLGKKHNYLHDLPSLDPELYKNLLYLKNNPQEVSQLDLYFVIEDNEYGEQKEIELLPGGKDMQVTEENVYKYIHLVANHRLNNQIRQQSSHFLRGFQQLISSEWIDMFNEHELQILISGSQDNMDINDLRSHVQYSGGYHENHPVIQMFWEILYTLDTGLQRKFLKFVTGCSRGPLLGFKHLEPQFCIQKTVAEDPAEAETIDRLPTSATCMNLLKLPPYRSKEMIREKLLYAITSEAGFDLS